jgi:formylglycine-generating enzyme required for sulfatase activity
MGKYEVTQQQWSSLMGSYTHTPPSSAYGLGDTYPTYNVSWDDAKNFISALNAHIVASGQGSVTVRLPSEAEWEYACEAGIANRRFYFGDSLGCSALVYCEDCAAGLLPGNRSDYMWYCLSSSTQGCRSVGLKLPNAFGLFDMHGNVFEWCEDDWHANYTGAPMDGSAWVGGVRETNRVVRGGAWDSEAVRCRVAAREGLPNGTWAQSVGFRVAASISSR